MSSYSTYAVADLLDAFASGEPVPGGGSAAAMTGALGASLLLMVAGLPKTKTGAPEEAADLAQAAARLRPLRDALLVLVDTDTAAYASLLAAFRMAKATDGEKTARRQAIDVAMRAAIDAPLDTMRACQQALRGALVVVDNGFSGALSDAGVGAELLLAASRSAALNVDTNLPALKDADYAARVQREREELARECAADAGRVRAGVNPQRAG